MDLEPVIVKTYKGNQASATLQFHEDAAMLAELGYVPTSQSWAPGSYGLGTFILALLLCFVLIGILIFVCMLLVKPDGSLSVTYQLHKRVEPPSIVAAEKTCPKCAEQVKAAATVCRFCGHNF
jgi:hypothetical protein